MSILCVFDAKFYVRKLNPLSIGYAIRLALGADLPEVEQHGFGNLGHSVPGALTLVNATHSGILTPYHSSSPHGLPSRQYGRSPTTLVLRTRITNFRLRKKL